MSSFEFTKSVFNVTVEKNSYSNIIPGHRKTKSAEETDDELNKLLDIRSQNGIDLGVEQVRKKGLFF